MRDSKRIASIDALRGITLLGIFLVHTIGGFGFSIEESNMLKRGIDFLLSNKMAPIFSTLFGVSFYLVLRNGNTTSTKFFWRCCLLIGFGLFNKIFYTYDALMWYGLWGICLIPFRHKSAKSLLHLSIICYFLSWALSYLHLGDLFIPNNVNDRYLVDTNFYYVITYPLWESVLNYFYIVLQSGVLGTLSYFLFGYFLAKIGIIENLKEYINRITIKDITYVMFFIFVCYSAYYFLRFFEYFDFKILRRIANIVSFIFYATFFL